MTAGSRLEQELRRLADDLAFPPTPALAESVAPRLVRGPTRRPRWRPVLVAASVTVLVAVGVSLLSPTIRTAVADLLGVPGIQIVVDQTTIPAGQLGRELELGGPITLSEARSGVRFTILLPGTLGEPDEIYLQKAGPVVWLAYRARPGLPAIGESRIGLLVAELQGQLDDFHIEKLLPTGVEVQAVEVGDHRGFWIEGEHVVLLFDSGSRVSEEPARLAERTLLWEQDGVTLRLESALDREAAVRLAESMAPENFPRTGKELLARFEAQR